MKKNIAAALLIALMASGCAGSSWWSKQYTDGHVLARVIYDEAMKLSGDTSKKEEFVPLLSNSKTIFTETNDSTVTVRDVAFAILEEAGQAELPVKWASSKFIYSCTINDSLYRANIPVLSDADFAEVIKTIQQPSALDRQKKAPAASEQRII